MLPVYRGTVRPFQKSPAEHTANPGNPAQPCPSRKHPHWLNLGETTLIYSYEPVFIPSCYTSEHQGTTQDITADDSEGSHNAFHLRTHYCLG